MKKIILLMLFLLVSCNTLKYGAPVVEDCIILATVTDYETKFRCGCIHEGLSKKTFSKLVANVKKQMSNHPNAEEALYYLEDNKSKIIKSKEYILDGYYCRGYSATSARDREKLENWAEENRVKRIKAEKKRRRW